MEREEIVHAVKRKIKMYKHFRDMCLANNDFEGAREYKSLSDELRWVLWLLKEDEDSE